MTGPAIISNTSFLDNIHPVVKNNAELWRMNERRLRGGWRVMQELRRFRWEINAGATAYDERVKRAVYMNFPAMHTAVTVGHIFRKHPAPGEGFDTGSLGEVRKLGDTAEPTLGTVIWRSTDGVGRTGSLWPRWWGKVARFAMATGHRWIHVEASMEAPASVGDQLTRGKRPYLVERSPNDVPDFHYELGVLQYAIIRFPMRRIRISDAGEIQGNDNQRGYLLMTRAASEAVPRQYRDGGWFMFGPDKAPLVLNGRRMVGRFETTEGDIPMFPFYFERDEGTDDDPAMSRPAITELGALAVNDMDIVSAANYNLWRACSGVEHILGVHKDSWKLAKEKGDEGSQWIPWAADPVQGIVPSVVSSSAGAVASDITKARLDLIRNDAKTISASHAASEPDSSGISKRAGFGETKAPLLADFAAEIEQGMNLALFYLAKRLGVTPDASVAWPREFDVIPGDVRIRNFLEQQNLAKVTSPTATAAAMVAAVQDAGFVPDGTEMDKVRKEYETAALAAMEQAAQFAALLNPPTERTDPTKPPGDGPPAPPTPAPPAPPKPEPPAPPGS